MLKKEVKASDKIYLATDPDREGEAISWHLKDALDIKDDKYERIVFNEITKDAILNSFSKARKIDDLMVRSQETRRILDRIIGFRLSKLMQSKTGGKSAGRVQSVALKLICDREEEIKNFISEEYSYNALSQQGHLFVRLISQMLRTESSYIKMKTG